MPIIFTNWKLNKVGLEIFFESWVALEDHSRFKSIKAISKYYTQKNSYGNSLQDRKKTHFHQYIIPLNGLKLKNYCGGKGWTFSLNGDTILIMFSSRTQNSRYPSQSLQEIEDLINEVNSGIPVVLLASSSEIVTQMINESIKSGSYIQLPIPEPIFSKRFDETRDCIQQILDVNVSKIDKELDMFNNPSYFIKKGYEPVIFSDEKTVNSDIESSH